MTAVHTAVAAGVTAVNVQLRLMFQDTLFKGEALQASAGGMHATAERNDQQTLYRLARCGLCMVGADVVLQKTVMIAALL